MSHVSALTLHRYRYGELPETEVASLKAHLSGCALCQGRLSAQENHRAAFEMTPVPEALRRPARARGWAWAGLLVPALAAALIVLIPGGQVPIPEEDAAEETRIKGDSGQLEVWLDDGEDGRKLSPGAPVQAGDRVQLRYRAPGGWVAFAGLDGRGTLEIYRSLQVSPDAKGWTAAPFSLTLDNAPGEQRFFAVFTPARPTEEQIERAVRSGLMLPGMKIEEIQLLKPD